MNNKLKYCLVLMALPALLSAGCTTTTSTTPAPVEYSRYELTYLLLDEYSDYFWCDPYLWPIGRPEQEKADALERFPEIRASAGEFDAILERLGLPEITEYSETEKVAIYRQHNLLSGAVQLTAAGDEWEFELRIGEGDGKRVRGAITRQGVITVQDEEPSINTCPICLAAGTLVDTPGGPVPVELIRPGTEVWTFDAAGRPNAATVLAVAATSVPPSFRPVRLSLADGRGVTASPGHPTAEGRPIGSYQVGDNLDGSTVTAVETVNYDGDTTYDLLPAGATGFYRAGGIMLGSTLRQP